MRDHFEVYRRYEITISCDTATSSWSYIIREYVENPNDCPNSIPRYNFSSQEEALIKARQEVDKMIGYP